LRLPSSVGYILLRAFHVAHEKIVEGIAKEELFDLAGTATLLGTVNSSTSSDSRVGK
jgi:hypothetical protein